jgi:hypothetical protein
MVKIVKVTEQKRFGKLLMSVARPFSTPANTDPPSGSVLCLDSWWCQEEELLRDQQTLVAWQICDRNTKIQIAI